LLTNGKLSYLCTRIKKETSNTLKMSVLTTERKKELFKTHGGSETNTGSTEAQIAMLTERIKHISGHMQKNKKDFGTNRGLIKLVGERKSLLSYLSKTDLEGYRKLLVTLNLRK
jgi:small subunit ribosomal protein S15